MVVERDVMGCDSRWVLEKCNLRDCIDMAILTLPLSLLTIDLTICAPTNLALLHHKSITAPTPSPM
jgi:hypothetical protein